MKIKPNLKTLLITTSIILAISVCTNIVMFTYIFTLNSNREKTVSLSTNIQSTISPKPTSKEEIKKWINLLNLDEKNAEQFSKDFDWIEEYKINDNESLVKVVNGVGAYQLTYEVYYYNYPANQYKRISFQEYEIESKKPYTSYSLVGLLDWDQSTKTLTNHYKLSGAGNCGSIATYNIVDQKAVLKNYSIRDVCDDDINARFTQVYP